MKREWPQTDKPLAFSYVRMSTDLQLKGDSLRRQEELSKQYVEDHDLFLVEDFKLEDIGVSAFKGANVSTGALGVFIEAIKAGEIPKGSYLLVESFDRLSRQNINASVSLFFEITSNGINLVTLMDNQIYKAGDANLQQLIYSIVVMSRAFEESETKSKRLLSAWANKRKNASSHKLTKHCPAWLQLSDDRSKFNIISGRERIVRRIFDEAASGLGAYSIARKLNAEKVPPFGKSKGWVISYIAKILNNRAVLGEYQPHHLVNGKRVPEGEPIQNYYPKIIEEDLFLRVKAGQRLRATKGSGRKGETQANLFTHIAKCYYCGAPMHHINKGNGPKGGKYLKCSAAHQGLDCVSTSWKYQDFETSFLYFAREVDLTATLSAANETSKRQMLEEKLIVSAESLRQLEFKRNRTFDLISENDTPTAFVAEKLKECEADIQAEQTVQQKLEKQLGEIEQNDAENPQELLKLIAELQDHSTGDISQKRRVVANRLRSIIASLRLAVEGKRPLQQKLEKAFSVFDDDPDYKADLIAHGRETAKETGGYNPTFTVIFTDNISRVVRVDKEDPTKYVAIADFNPINAADNGSDSAFDKVEYRIKDKWPLSDD